MAEADGLSPSQTQRRHGFLILEHRPSSRQIKSFCARYTSQDSPASIFRFLDTLSEAQARWYVGQQVIAVGRGGLKLMHEMTSMSHPTILRKIYLKCAFVASI